MTTGQRIKYYRKEKGYTQNELAEIIGVSMQAISKWETDSGMPDISQIVPLCKALDVSADKVLGLGDDEEVREVLELREKIGKHTIAFSVDEAKRIYSLAAPVFAKHPTNSFVAFNCLESLSVLIANECTDKDKLSLIRECSRYELCISRYETNPDMLFKSYYVLSRCYNLLGEVERAEQIKERMPTVFGDRTYWEAEYAFADGDMKTALEKCKKSFAEKARFISRCIRLARMISVASDGDAEIVKQIELNEYMLRIINAFLSGGDYIPHRMMYQKLSLLSGMVAQYADLGMKDKAEECMKELVGARDIYDEFISNPLNKNCLMFPDGDLDGADLLTADKLEMYVSSALKRVEE